MLFDSENISLEYEARGKCLCWDTVGDVTNMYGLAGLPMEHEFNRGISRASTISS